jgi:hypothetical protein
MSVVLVYCPICFLFTGPTFCTKKGFCFSQLFKGDWGAVIIYGGGGGGGGGGTEQKRVGVKKVLIEYRRLGK